MRKISLICAAVVALTVIPFAQENDLYRPTVAFMPFTDLNAGEESDIPLPPGGGNGKIINGEDYTVEKGEVIDVDIVLTGGDLTVFGVVNGDATVTGGDLYIYGTVNGTAVTVGGCIHVKKGAILKGDAVTIGGYTIVDEGSTFNGEKVSIGGDIPGPPGGGIPAPPGGGAFDVANPMAWLSNGIPEMMYFMLERTYTVNLYNISDMRTVLKKYDNSDLTAGTPFDTLASAAKTKGVEYIVGGTFDKQEDSITITAELFDVDGSSIGSEEVSGKTEDIFKLEEEAAKAMLALLDIEYADKIMLRDPTSSLEAYKFFSLGTAKYYTGERLAQFSLGMNIDADFAELHLKIAEANRLEGAAAPAKASYEIARNLSDVYPEAPAQLGVLAKKLTPDTPESVKAFAEEALSMDASYVKAVELLSQYYYKEKDYKTASELCGKFIAIQPGNKMGYYSLGNSLWQIGVTSPKWETILKKAIKQYDTAIDIDPRFGEAYYARGSLHSIFEDATAMIADFKSYLKYKPKAGNRIDIIKTIYENGGDCAGLLAEGYVTQEEIDAAQTD
ncbi:MAG: hypothetical protein GY771_01485 [bacterium]|nr:hypothetical protein [bacterium]